MSEIDWLWLQHAYGPATNIPALLAAARTAPVKRSYDDEPWFTRALRLLGEDETLEPAPLDD